MLKKNVSRTYRLDPITLAYLDAMQTKISGKINHTDLIKQSVHFYANYVLDQQDVQNIQIELLFNNFDIKKNDN